MAKDKTDAPKPQQRSKKATETKASRAKTAAPKASQKSQEFVVDSDDEDAPAEDRRVKKVTAPVPSAGKKKDRGASTKAPPAPVASAKLPALDSSDEDEDEDSESNDDDAKDVPSPRKPSQVPAKTNGVKRAASDSVASEDEDDEESDEDEVEPAAKRQKAANVTTAKPASSSEEDESDDDEESESEAPVRPPPAANADKPQVSSKAKQHIADTASEAIAAKPFQPPSGYSKLDMSNTDVVDDFDGKALAGKQVWHITAPSDVPLSAITEVALDAIQSGRSVLSHKGAEYALNEDKSDDEHTVVFLPGHGGFTPAKQQIQKTLHLQQKIALPNLSMRQANQTTGSAAAANIAEAAVSTVRPQPKGLRMRYRPTGYGDGELGLIGMESSEEDETQRSTSGIQFPKVLGAHGTSTQQATAGAEQPNGPAKKPKKKRKEQQKDPLAESSMANGSSSKKSVLPEADGDVAMADADAPAKLSKEEKAKRKEEKRLRKEAKLKSKTN